jgi:hypothetical protein
VTIEKESMEIGADRILKVAVVLISVVIIGFVLDYANVYYGLGFKVVLEYQGKPTLFNMSFALFAETIPFVGITSMAIWRRSKWRFWGLYVVASFVIMAALLLEFYLKTSSTIALSYI